LNQFASVEREKGRQTKSNKKKISSVNVFPTSSTHLKKLKKTLVEEVEQESSSDKEILQEDMEPNEFMTDCGNFIKFSNQHCFKIIFRKHFSKISFW